MRRIRATRAALDAQARAISRRLGYPRAGTPASSDHVGPVGVTARAVDVTTLGGGPRGDAADEYIEVPDRMIAADTPTGEDLPERVAPPPAIVAGRAP